ncbi:MAG: endolytic transglycosylase MltG [Gemmatimonadetes bacterium]|nr:endolytic transglycosylase MltG [Gemmatimonadota bacterium]
MKRVLVVAVAASLACGGGSGPPVQVVIPEGATLRAAAESLTARGVIGSAGWFRWYATLLQGSGDIPAGVYRLRTGMSAGRALAALAGGRAALRRIVVPEGLMLGEVANTVSRQLSVPQADIENAATDSALLARAGSPGPTLEGYLYPSTYLVRYGAPPREILAQMVDEFLANWQPGWNARLDAIKLTRHQVVTLASIVEGEVRYEPDRKYVASVYLNRLRKGMRLQADPTVIYALGKRRRLFEKDYLFRSRYNTYLVDGLPPGPIGQPSAASIEAALYPAETSFLYFVAQGDGKHVFSRTYPEHLQAIRTARVTAR